MSLVLDSSVTLARIFPDEWTPAILQLFDDEVKYGAWVPTLWKLEVANVLALSVKKGRLTQERRDRSLKLMETLPIATDPKTGTYAWTDTLALADRHKLTV